MSTAPRPLQRLGQMPVGEFLARTWQRRALCVRQALRGFVNPATRAQLFEMACSGEVESRLVTSFGQRWRLQHGPFEPAQLPAPGRKGWTLLVQGVDLHDAAVARLAMRFRFLPAARFDDVMVSYASDGGGVGPHVDQYDVFLLQAQGRRRWRIARRFDPALVAGVPLRVLANFQAEQEWVLEPGDLLYLPPGVAHEGVALGESITISIGFRLPTWEEIAEAWAEHRGRTAPRAGRVPDATRRRTQAPARLPAAMIDAAVRELRRAVPSRVQARRTLLEHLTDPKPSVMFAPPRPAASAERFRRAACARGVQLDLRTRMLYEGRDVAINGELVGEANALTGTNGRQMTRLLHTLANDRSLAPAALAAISAPAAADLFPILHSWYRFGWLQLAPA